MHSIGKGLIFFLCCLSLMILRADCAAAVDLSPENCREEHLSHSDMIALNSNQYHQERPIIIFFPGSAECSRPDAVMRFVRDYHLYDDLHADFLAVAIRTKGSRPEEWEEPAGDLLAFLAEKYETEPFDIIVDAVSFGGCGACCLTQLLQDHEIPVRELNLADACVSSCVTADWIDQLALGGTRVNLWGCYENTRISKATRMTIEALQDRENVQGQLFSCTHGQVLAVAVHDFGLHQEYRDAEQE
ncbi:MAG: hypothetical protein IKQ45_06805 [Clostridia bacterium]|nr:hypothetical protein [Clostridia bacterium]